MVDEKNAGTERKNIITDEKELPGGLSTTAEGKGLLLDDTQDRGKERRVGVRRRSSKLVFSEEGLQSASL